MNIKKSLLLLIMCLALPLVGQAQSAHWAITPTYQSVTPFAPGLFKVKTYASVGICDADEKWVVSLAMDSITNIVNGYAFALTKSKDKYRIAYIIRDNGTREAVKEEVYAGEYLFFNEERCPVTNKKGKYGYINPSGALVVDCDYSSALPFINGRALVTKEKGGFAGLLKKGKAKVFEIDLQGKAREVSQIDPSALNPSYTGLMSATYTPNPDPSYQRFSDDKEYGYRKGNRIILPTQFESAGSVSDDCAIVMVNHLFGVVRFNAAEVDCKVSESGGHLKAQATLPGVWENKVASIVRLAKSLRWLALDWNVHSMSPLTKRVAGRSMSWYATNWYSGAVSIKVEVAETMLTIREEFWSVPPQVLRPMLRMFVLYQSRSSTEEILLALFPLS